MRVHLEDYLLLEFGLLVLEYLREGLEGVLSMVSVIRLPHLAGLFTDVVLPFVLLELGLELHIAACPYAPEPKDEFDHHHRVL